MVKHPARGLALVVLALLVGACAERPPAEMRLAHSLQMVDEALGRGEVDRAERAWHGAYAAALASRRWQGSIEVGAAYLRIGQVGGFAQSARARARQNYLTALYRARAQRSIEGVVRAANAFAMLGDREMAAVAVRIAEDLAMAEGEATALMAISTVGERR